ncbi:MAG: iron-containing alcohol dehydrogenase [Nitrososphaerales archaeon]
MLVEEVKISEKLLNSAECGCEFPHNKTLKAVIFGAIEDGLDKLNEYQISPPYAVLCDNITYNVLGRRVGEYLQADCFIFQGLFNEDYWLNRLNHFYRTIIGVGGGTVLDTAKYLAYLTSSKYIAIPTAPSNDGIVSPVAVIFTPEGRQTYVTCSPCLTIVDLSILSSAPWSLKASGFGDAFAKITSLKDWELGRDELHEKYCVTAEKHLLLSINLALKALEYVKEQNVETQGLNYLIQSLIHSGIAMMITHSSRPATGSEHLIGRYLELNYNIPHGIAVAIGTIIAAKIHQLFNMHWWREKSYSYSSLLRYCKQLKIPLSLTDLKVPMNEIINATINAPKLRPERYTILHKVKLDEENVSNIVKELFIL